MKISCGIDFGTSNSAIAAVCPGQEPRLVKSPEGKVTMPTAVFYPAAKELTPCFGMSAVQAYVNAERGRFMRSMKRVLGTPLMGSLTEVNGRNLQFEEILAVLRRFRQYKKVCARFFPERKFLRMISCHRSGWGWLMTACAVSAEK